MSALARAYKITEIEADLTLVDDITKECFRCDPDNPRAVSKQFCSECGGTGRQKLAIGAIAAEITQSRINPSKMPKNTDLDDDDDGENASLNDEELFLEY